MGRKGQVSALLIICAVILITISLVSLINSPERTSLPAQKAQTEDPLPEQTKQFVTACLQSTLEDGVRSVANRGGFYPIPPEMEAYEKIVPFYITPKYSRIPTDTEISGSIERYVQDGIWACLDEFDTFKREGAMIIAGKPVARATMRSRDVMIEAQMPITIDHDGRTTAIDDFQASTQARLPEMAAIAREATVAQEAVAFDRLEDLLRKPGFKGNIMIDNETVVYMITDPASKITFGASVKNKRVAR